MKTILIVDDEVVIAQLLRSLLEEEGYKVVVAANGRQALEELRRIRPDLMLVDLMMPLMDGLSFCKEVQGDPNYHATPIVLMSAANKQPSCSECSYAAFINKPFDLSKLLNVISTILDKNELAE